ncbi:diptheria toxin resistance protein [Danaus plexippus plexippus]|uniref:2-(3-amino-3-carboxypropyl)histidine synthase subunit 2 n=1 Tax=Danaus plexippus plexippus TaxID=278856 RepID=A0A212FIS5_DANPL|nr:diptheria toxin resistance protein [Danaus plexippus plexippus]
MSNFTTDGKICIERELEVAKSEIEFDNLEQRYSVTEICNWLKEHNFSKVCLQFPDELIGVSAAIYQEIKKNINVDLYILGDTSYASCCVDSVAAMHVQSDAVIHFGHSCFTKTNIPVFTVLPKRNLSTDAIESVLRDHFKSDDTKLCLFYDAEYEHCKALRSKTFISSLLQQFCLFFDLDNIQTIILGRLVKNETGVEYPMESLRDCICIYIGSKGQTVFNFSVSVPALKWFLLDPEDKKLEHLEETIWFKRRRFLIEKCKDANVIGILVCKLAGEQTKQIVKRMKQICKANGKKSYIVSVGKPNVAKLANFPEIDIYVMIACPENDLYNNRDFYRPIIYPFELEVALNSNREQYYNYHVTDYDDLLPGKRHHLEIDHTKQATDVSLVTGKIRENKIHSNEEGGMEVAEKQNWALESIGQNLQERSWKGLEQKFGETDVKNVEEGRKGIPLQYSNEPE